MSEHEEFRVERVPCPRCGCTWFGSTGPVHALVRYCKGSECGFKWPMSEDNVHFREVLSRPYEPKPLPSNLLPVEERIALLEQVVERLTRGEVRK